MGSPAAWSPAKFFEMIKREGRCWSRDGGNLFIYQARESSLVTAGFLTAQFLQKLKFIKPLL